MLHYVLSRKLAVKVSEDINCFEYFSQNTKKSNIPCEKSRSPIHTVTYTIYQQAEITGSYWLIADQLVSHI